jgi:hypothetical protein
MASTSLRVALPDHVLVDPPRSDVEEAVSLALFLHRAAEIQDSRAPRACFSPPIRSLLHVHRCEAKNLDVARIADSI